MTMENERKKISCLLLVNSFVRTFVFLFVAVAQSIATWLLCICMLRRMVFCTWSYNCQVYVRTVHVMRSIFRLLLLHRNYLRSILCYADARLPTILWSPSKYEMCNLCRINDETKTEQQKNAFLFEVIKWNRLFETCSHHMEDAC